MQRFVTSGAVCALALSLMAWTAAPALAQVDVDNGYLDRFDLRDGRQVDIGSLGGGTDADENEKKIFVAPQSDVWEADGALTGVVHGKLRVTNFQDVNGDGMISHSDLDAFFDVSWQLIANDKNGGVNFIADTNGSVNLPPTPGGTGSLWNVAACGTNGGFDVGGGLENCDPFAVAAPYTGFVDYTFPVRVPGTNPHTPGLAPSDDINYILTALVGLTSLGGGSVTYGPTASFDPNLGVTEAGADLFGPQIFLNFPGESANIFVAGLLTSIEIVVTPEPGTMTLLAVGGLAIIRRRRRNVA
jgi:hypothetical protein